MHDSADNDKLVAMLRNELGIMRREGLTARLPTTSALIARELENAAVNASSSDASPIIMTADVLSTRTKLWIPTDKFPTYNFIGRILGPRGATLKQLENETGCHIVIRGTGSLRNKRNEDKLKGRRGYEHLSEPLHLVIESSPEITDRDEASLAIASACRKLQSLMTPLPDERDDEKRRQLRELRKLNSIEPTAATATYITETRNSEHTSRTNSSTLGLSYPTSPQQLTKQFAPTAPFDKQPSNKDGRCSDALSSMQGARDAPQFIPGMYQSNGAPTTIPFPSSPAMQPQNTQHASRFHFEPVEQTLFHAQQADCWAHLTSSWLDCTTTPGPARSAPRASLEQWMPYDRRHSRSPEKQLF